LLKYGTVIILISHGEVFLVFTSFPVKNGKFVGNILHLFYVQESWFTVWEVEETCQKVEHQNRTTKVTHTQWSEIR